MIRFLHIWAISGMIHSPGWSSRCITIFSVCGEQMGDTSVQMSIDRFQAVYCRSISHVLSVWHKRLLMAHFQQLQITLNGQENLTIMVSSTHHAVGDHSRVGIFTVLIRQNWDFHTLKECENNQANHHVADSSLPVTRLVAVPREDGRIIGGYECEPHSRPYMASLNYGYHFCGGVLINRQWVLSVAHCWYNPYAMQIMLGEHDVRVFEGTEQLMKTDNIIWHPNYDYQTLDYDIMLIKLFHPVEVTDAVAPIPLPSGCPIGGLPCSVSGWGNTAMDGEVNMPTRLQCLDVPVVDQWECENAYPGMITRRMMCAGYMDGGRDACNGDSGSPLVCLGEVHGLVSWGQGCALPNYPGVYVKVCEFLYWIEDVLAANP